MEDHNSAAEAMIKIKDNGRKPFRVRLSKGFLFKLVVKTDKTKEKVKSGKDDDAKMLRELLANAKKLNEAISKDLYADIKDEPKDEAKDEPFFKGSNKHLKKQFKDHFVFETKKTIYRKLNAFIKEWSIGAGIAIDKDHRNSSDIATKFPTVAIATKFPTVEASVTQLKQTFIGSLSLLLSPSSLLPLSSLKLLLSLSLYRILQKRK